MAGSDDLGVLVDKPEAPMSSEFGLAAPGIPYLSNTGLSARN